jgi:hypothetical protein
MFGIKGKTLLFVILGLLVCVLAVNATKAGEAFRRWKYPGGWFKVMSTMYEGDLGAAGVNLDEYPITRVRVSDKFGRRTLYPIAFHTKDVRGWKYKIIEIRHKNKRIFGHVVDECAAGDCHKNFSKAKKKGAKLIDIHKTAWKTLGMSSYGTYTMKGRVVGYVAPKGSGKKAMAGVLTKDGRKGYVPKNWKV